jgi:coproporphyrinogen III oxidase-like Fe-S oxidoreductase
VNVPSSSVIAIAPEVTVNAGAPTLSTDAAGIYIHVPFCAHVCSYCDFNTYAGQDALIPATSRPWRGRSRRVLRSSSGGA